LSIILYAPREIHQYQKFDTVDKYPTSINGFPSIILSKTSTFAP